jgi:hypothetical protein
MKKSIYIILASVLVVGACNFSVGTKKDLITGLSYTYNGFSVDEVVMAGPDNKIVASNDVPLNSTVAIVAQGLSNYQLKDDKAFPGMSLVVTDKEGTAVISETDVFAESDGYSAADASILRGTITVGTPMKAGETYHIKMRIWDKIKPENELTADVDIDVR